MHEPVSPWLSPRLRSAMLRFASLHLQPREDAEDAVQDALLALAQASKRWQAAEDPRRYVFGVLKNKITDRLRARYRHATVSTDADDNAALDDSLFTPAGQWIDAVAPVSWNTPEHQLRSDQFFAVVDACVDRLPEKVARVFSMKELLECDAQEVCATLGLSKSDYWQCMSRARKQLQLCLHVQGYGEGDRP